MVACASAEDIQRWEKEGRHDIIARLCDGEVVWAGDRIIAKNCPKVGVCHYLSWDGSAFFCQIYETRPAVCRNYRPGSSGLCPQYSDEQ
jgi:Fe-S-cluster containining protein